MKKEIARQILELLQKEYPKDFSIEEISAALGIHRNTISKYIYGLEMAQSIKCSRTIGRAKMYSYKRREIVSPYRRPPEFSI